MSASRQAKFAGSPEELLLGGTGYASVHLFGALRAEDLQQFSSTHKTLLEGRRAQLRTCLALEDLGGVADLYFEEENTGIASATQSKVVKI